jgi:hypothetical protein
MPTTQHDDAPGSAFLGVVRESQAAVIDVLRVWSDIGQRLTRNLGLPVAGIDIAGAVDRAFDVAEQTLATQRQLALALAGVATRQVETTVNTVVETIDTSDEAAGTAVKAVEGTVRERVQQVEGELKESREGTEQPAAAPSQHRKFDGRTYEERSLEELRERAAELQIEGRSAMNKEELIAALRNDRKSRSARSEARKQAR